MLTLWTVEDVRKALAKEGFETTGATIRSDVSRGILKPLAQTLGRETRLFDEADVLSYVSQFQAIRMRAEERQKRGGHGC